MIDIMERFNETVNLAILSDRHIVYVDMVEPHRTLRTDARVGERHPVHLTSLGKAIVAFLPGALCRIRFSMTCFRPGHSRR